MSREEQEEEEESGGKVFRRSRTTCTRNDRDRKIDRQTDKQTIENKTRQDETRERRSSCSIHGGKPGVFVAISPSFLDTRFDSPFIDRSGEKRKKKLEVPP